MACLDCTVKFEDFFSENLFTWCTNCGNYGITAAVKRALVAEQIPPHQVFLCYDVGCNGNGADKTKSYTFHGLHGRVIPFAVGASLANRNIPVIASAGDGATFSEGINHLIHAVRNNYNITFLLHNNQNYALTKGQASATTPKGVIRTASPDGVVAEPINPMSLILNLNPSFAARTFSGDVKQMTEIIRAGIKHKGFSFIEILQTCTTFNKETPHEWYQERVFDTLFEPDYNNRDLDAAIRISRDIQDRIATGVIYQRDDIAEFSELLANRRDVSTQLVDEVRNYKTDQLSAKFR